MNLHIFKAVLITGVSAMTLFSCSKEAAGEVKSIGQSFEEEATDDYPEVVTSYEEEVLELTPGAFSAETNDADKTATFNRLFINGENFMWSFPDATPASSTEANPGTITFPGAGEYTVTLNVTIDDEDYSHSETIAFE
jgi:hypothetical protein